MKRIGKPFWGCIPLALFLLCVAFVAVVQTTTGDTLRIVPRNLLICFGVGSLGTLMLWGNIKYDTSRKGADKRRSHMVSMGIKTLSVSIFAVLIFASLFVMGFSHRPEHLVIRNGVKMVASVNSFLDEQVYYYQYKNPFFYGKELGYEYYGSGGNDPLARTPKPDPIRWAFYDLDGNVIESGTREDTNDRYENEEPEDQADKILQQKAEVKALNIEVMDNREDELVFSCSIDDFIDSYNGFYWKENKVRYLLPSSQWRSYPLDTAIHSNHETIYYYFTQDEQIWSLPTLSVSVPTNGDFIQEITLNFDDHSYTEAMYDLYEEMCFYAIKVLFPDLTDDRIIELYTTLNHLAYDSVTSVKYTSESVPCALYHKDGIGVYPYFAVGECMHICVIPVTQETIKEFEQKGVEIYEIQ